MSKKINIIEINGHRYDAHSGERLSIHHGKPLTSHSVTGLTENPISVQDSVQIHTAADNGQSRPVKTLNSNLKTTELNTSRHSAKPLERHHPQSAKTLMRQAVSKPSPSLKRRVKAQGPASLIIKKPMVRAAAKRAYASPNPTQLRHAQQITKSHLIKRFNHNQLILDSPDYAEPITPLLTPVHQALAGSIAADHKHPKTTTDLLQRVLRQTAST